MEKLQLTIMTCFTHSHSHFLSLLQSNDEGVRVRGGGGIQKMLKVELNIDESCIG